MGMRYALPLWVLPRLTSAVIARSGPFVSLPLMVVTYDTPACVSPNVAIRRESLVSVVFYALCT